MSPKVVLITSSELRHRYYAGSILQANNLLGVLIEKKRSQADDTSMTQIVRSHFDKRDKKEKQYFGTAKEFEELGCHILRTEWGGSNSIESVSWLKDLNPDFVLVYGTGIIKEPIIDLFKSRIINCHLGLSPYYKGAATNFWPLVNGEPECVGATFHILELEVDAGPILHQVRPKAESKDDCHDLGFKTIIAASNIIGEVLNKFIDGELQPVVQKGQGRIYRKKDFHEQAVLKMQKNFAEGMIIKYLQEKQFRDNQFSIIKSF